MRVDSGLCLPELLASWEQRKLPCVVVAQLSQPIQKILKGDREWTATEVGGSFAGCKGLLVVSFGKVEVRVDGTSQVLHEGESCPVSRGGLLWIRAEEEWADVLFFEETRPTVAAHRNSPTNYGNAPTDSRAGSP